MDSLFNLEPTKPTPLQAARRALTDAERVYDEAQEKDPEADEELISYERAVQRFTELVKAEELAELNKLQKS
tara:strand:- start:1099 stop:1314 length:216 start_codon:yes stop_codon:yes gene_type:complete